MIYLLFAILIITSCVAMVEDRLPYKKDYFYILLGAILILVASVKPLGVDNDSETYNIDFLHYDDPIVESSVEPTFLLISKILNTFTSDVHWIFFIYVSIGLTLKFKALRNLTPLYFLGVAVYLGNYFIFHEFTQIRAGVASGFLLLSVKPIAEGRKWQAFGNLLIAALFHISSLTLLPLLLLNNNGLTLRQRGLWAGIIPFGYIIWALGLSIPDIPIPYISDKLEVYKELKEEGLFDSVNVFNMVYLVRIAIYLYILYFYDTISLHMKYLPILIKFMGISLFCFTGLSALPVLAFRVSELFGVVEIALFTGIFYTVKPGWIGKMAVSTIAMAMYLINTFYNNILHFV